MIIPAEYSTKLYQPFFSRPLAEISPREVAEMRPTMHCEIARRANGFLFLRTQCAVVRHFGNLTITPEATSAAIYIVRNPLDIAPAYSAANGYSIDRAIAQMSQKGRLLGKSSKRTYQVIGSWSENVESWNAGIRGRIFCLRFEDLLVDPERKFSEIVQFLSMKVTAKQIAKASDNSIAGIIRGYKKSGSREENRMSPLELLRAGAALRGRRLLTTQQIATIAAAHRDQMNKFGYWQ